MDNTEIAATLRERREHYAMSKETARLPAGRSSPPCIVVSRPSGGWVTLHNDKTRYVAGPWETEGEARTWVATRHP